MAMVLTVLAQFVCIQLVSGAVVNVALRKPVQVSSRHLNRDPAIAVNGNTTAVDPCCVMHTAVGRTAAWWWVDLQTQVQDATVKIYFRTDYLRRRNGTRLYTSTNPFSSYPSGQLCHTVTGKADGTDIPDVVSMKCTGTWGYLMVYTQTDNDGSGALIDFGEVQVLGCDNTYGVDCDKSCNSRQCAVTPVSCDRYTGACPAGGCKLGWMGGDCTQECPEGKFGVSCLSCGIRHCEGESDCPSDGACSRGCQDGWLLSNCTQACPSGTYGPGCVSICGNCTGDHICNHMTGNCPGDCKAGWRGMQCKNTCLSGTFGVNCKGSCGHCIGTCDVVDGHCPGGCVDGYCGPHCNNKLERTGTDTVMVGVIGSVIGAVFMFLLGGGILLCLARSGRLKWMKGPDHLKQSSEMGDITSAQVSRQTERPDPESVHSDYAVLEVDTELNNTKYDIIKNRVYENS